VTRLDVIRMIGDVLTEIDVTVGSLKPSDPAVTRLQDLRRLLDARQLMLTREVVNDNTVRFRKAAEQLRAVNAEMKGTIRRVDNITRVIENVTRFLDAVTSFMTAIRAFR
jgi:hypothetical protein